MEFIWVHAAQNLVFLVATEADRLTLDHANGTHLNFLEHFVCLKKYFRVIFFNNLLLLNEGTVSLSFVKREQVVNVAMKK